jgi:hypothetical protein
MAEALADSACAGALNEMTRLSENWYLEGRQILHACAPGVRVRWTGAPACECGFLAPRRVHRFYEWMTAPEPRPDPHPGVRGLTLIVIDPQKGEAIPEPLQASKS